MTAASSAPRNDSRSEAEGVGRAWEVIIVRAGESQNGNYYPDTALREAAPMFEGVRVYAKSNDEHLKGGAPDVNKLAGWISGARFAEGAHADGGYVAGTMNFAAGMTQLRETIADAWKRGKRDLVGLSVDLVARTVRDGARRIAKKITKVHSVDLIIEPSAGGGLIRLVEATDDSIDGASQGTQMISNRARELAAHNPCLADDLLDLFFNARTQTSFRECYVRITGDRRVTGRLENCDPSRMREALDTNSWPNVLGAAVTRRMVAEYRNGAQYGIWRKLVKIGQDITDFRTQRRTRFGGYGELPTVNEGDPYTALPSPADEEATYAVTKRGGTETLTLEMFKNDNISAIRLMPKRLAEAAQRTLAHFVLNILRTNPVIYDGVALFHATHNNLAAAALSASALNAARAALMHQTEPGSGDQLGTELAFLWVPLDLEETAVNLSRRGTNQDKTFIQSMKVEVVPVWYWEDTNDWCVSADPEKLASIELGFMDGNEEPDLFIQDAPSAGSMFSNDQLTYKIRHIYGGTVIDFRGLYKSIL